MQKHLNQYMLKLLALTLFWAAVFIPAKADEPYRIIIHLKGISDSECYLAYHLGNRQYLLDTAYVDQQGMATFTGQDALNPGVYLVVLADQRNFEILIDQNQQFTIYTDPEDFVGAAEFAGSPDNEAFYHYLLFIREKGQRRSQIQSQLNNPQTTPHDRTSLGEELQKLDMVVREKQDEIIQAFGNGLLAQILRGQRDPELPEPPVGEDGLSDREAMYQIYKSKYFDNIDFGDGRILRTPVYHSRLRIFFNNVIIQHPDSIIYEADRLLTKTLANKDMFQYTLWYITNFAEASQIMGMDKVFVHMIENYYLTNLVDWVDDEGKNRLRQRAETLKPLLLGNRAPNLLLFDQDGKPVTMHDISANYLVLYFWDSECAFCRQAAPKLVEAHESLKEFGVKFMAINTEMSSQRWKNSLETYPADWIHVNDPENRSKFRELYDIYSIPTIFILDGNKRIVAKNLPADSVEAFLRQALNDH